MLINLSKIICHYQACDLWGFNCLNFFVYAALNSAPRYTCKSTVCSKERVCEKEPSGCPRIPARWKHIHSERHSSYWGRSQPHWGWACGREEWLREKILCLQRSAYVVRVRAWSELGSTLQNFMEQTCTLHLNTSCALICDFGFTEFISCGAWTFFFKYLARQYEILLAYVFFYCVHFALQALGLIIDDVDHVQEFLSV